MTVPIFSDGLGCRLYQIIIFFADSVGTDSVLCPFPAFLFSNCPLCFACPDHEVIDCFRNIFKLKVLGKSVGGENAKVPRYEVKW